MTAPMNKHVRYSSFRRPPLAPDRRGPVVIALLALGAWLVLIGGLAGISVGLLAGEVEAALPPAVLDPADDYFQSSLVFARDETTLLHEIVDPNLGRRTVVPLSDMSAAVIAATIATE